jgi:methylmalonyl-CoA mutase N-terminal domain/subunit
VIVGVNRFTDTGDADVPVMAIDPELERGQVQRLTRSRAERNATAVESTLAAVEATARGEANLLPDMKAALESGATLGEVSGALRNVFGEYRP